MSVSWIAVAMVAGVALSFSGLDVLRKLLAERVKPLPLMVLLFFLMRFIVLQRKGVMVLVAGVRSTGPPGCTMTHLPFSSSKKLLGGGSGVSNRGDGMVDLLGVFLEMVGFFCW